MNLKFWGRSAPAPIAAPTVERRGRAFSANRALAGMFKAAEAGNDKWATMPTNIDQITLTNHTVLVARSRQQWADNDYMRAYGRIIRQNIVGPKGVTMQAKVATPRGKLDRDTNAALEADFAEWAQKGNCDVTGKLSWRAAQELFVTTMARDGECIVRKVYGAEAGPHGFALQFLDPQRLPVWRMSNDLPGGGFIRFGIEYNRYGRPVWYHFTSTDESDAWYYSSGGVGFVKVPADDIIHDFISEHIGQKRGFPWGTSALFRLRNVNGFEDAAVQNARATASKMGFIEYKEGFGPEADDDEPVTIDAEPLSFHELPEGASIAEWSGQFPNNETAAFLKSQLRGASSGLGVPYNTLGSDLEGVNFSSIRHDTLDAREHYMGLQEHLVEGLVAPVREAHLKWRLLNAAIRVKGKPIGIDRLEACRAVAWQPRRWAWIDPKADVDSKLAECRGGFESVSAVIRARGGDPDAVFLDIAHSLEGMKAAGIPDKYIDLFMQGAIANNTKGGKPDTKEPATND